MLHVLLMILKITGIIIAVLLGVIIALLLILLFVPLRYKADMSADASAEDKISGIIRFNWLLHIVNGYVRYGKDGLNYRIRIFLFRFRDSSQESDELDETDELDEIYADYGSDESNKSYESQKLHKPDKTDRHYEEKKSAEPDIKALPEGEEQTPDDFTKQEKKWFQKLGEFFARFVSGTKQFFESTASMLTGTKEKVKGFFEKIGEKIEYFNTEINTPENRGLVKFLVKETKKVLWHIRPRKYIVRLKYGAESPDVTGQVTGYIAAANAFFNLNIDYTPSFDEEALEGSFYGRGHIRLFPLLWIAFIVYRDKQFKKMLKKFR